MIHRTACASALALVWLLSACGEKVGQGGGEAPAEAPAAPAGILNLSAEQIQRLGVRFEVANAAVEAPLGSAPATVAPPPNARVAVAAIIPGVVTRTLVVEGDSVRAGQPLAVVAARELFTVGAALEQASARAEMARANNRRLQQLASEGVIAGARADEARAALREAEAELAEQRRVLRLVNGSAAQGTYTLTAPIAGRVATASIETGSPIDGATAAYVIDAANRYELTAQLPERLVGQVRPGMSVVLSDGVRGEITSVGASLDPQTRSALLRARIPAAEGVLSGRAISVVIMGPAGADAVTAPVAAVTTLNGEPTVFVRTAQGAVARKVEVMDGADGTVVIRSGVKAGEAIAIQGVSELKSIAGQD